MALESNIFQWIGGSIDMTLNTFVQTTSANVITSFIGTFTIGGGLFFAVDPADDHAVVQRTECH